jgi:hypothetical protein
MSRTCTVRRSPCPVTVLSGARRRRGRGPGQTAVCRFKEKEGGGREAGKAGGAAGGGEAGKAGVVEEESSSRSSRRMLWLTSGMSGKPRISSTA